MPKENQKITIYTDGAAKGNPGKAGWAAAILLPQNYGGSGGVHEIGGRAEHATNNQMELTAPIEALKYLKNNFQKQPQVGLVAGIEIISDSKYVILGITEWIFNWQKNNWRNAGKKPVLNRELWEELYELAEEIKAKMDVCQRAQWRQMERTSGRNSHKFRGRFFGKTENL